MAEAAVRRKYESPRQLERQSTILAAARRMLEQEGYAGVTMRALATEAGVAQATLYNIYGSKDDLILSAVEDLLLGVEADVEALNPAAGIDSILVRTAVNARQVQSTPKYAEAMIRSLAGVQAGDPLVSLLYLRAIPFLKEHLAHAQAQGDIGPDHNIETIAQHLVAQQWGISFQWTLGIVPLEALVRERVRSEIMTLSAVATGPARQDLEQRLLALDNP